MPGQLEVNLDHVATAEAAHVQLHPGQNAVNYVHNQLGIPVPARPSYALAEIPRDLTTMRDEQVGDLLTVYGQWVAYIDHQLAHVDAERTSAEAYLDFIQAKTRIVIKMRSDGKKLTTQDKNDIMETNPQVIEAKEKYMFWESTYRLTKSLRDSTQLAWDTVSRRITQRGQEVDRMRRENNVAGVPSAARTFQRVGG